MALKNFLTNEELGGRFANQFQLVNHAIERAKSIISRGEQLDSNQASRILEMIVDDKNFAQSEEEIEEVI